MTSLIFLFFLCQLQLCAAFSKNVSVKSQNSLDAITQLKDLSLHINSNKASKLVSHITAAAVLATHRIFSPAATGGFLAGGLHAITGINIHLHDIQMSN